MTENFAAQLRLLPDYLGNHMLITLLPLLIGAAISVPLAVSVSRRPGLRGPVLGAVSVVQTIPGLALLALMVPLLAMIDAVTPMRVPALGFLPALLALAMYCMLPMLRNTVTGILGVDPALTEAARGLGMTPGQVLRQVELPLAAPVILAGVRTATVWCVGMATLATPVGQTCLGNYIFSGLQTRNWTAVLFGCVSAALLAIVLDGLLGLLERAAARRSRPLAAAGGAGLMLVLATGLAGPLLGTNAGAVQVGAKNFTEQYILSALIERRLAAAGLAAVRREGLGSTIVFDALVEGEIDVYVDYSGTIWANHMGRSDTPGAQVVLDEMAAWLDARGVTLLGALGFDNAYALAMRRDQAQARSVTSLVELAAHAPRLRMGADYEFFQRPEWRAVRDGYGLSFASQASFDPTFLYDAVARGDVDVISAFTSDGRIAANDLVTLDDPRQVLPPYDAVLLLSSGAAANSAVVAALRPLVGGIGIDAMRDANGTVDRGEQTVEAAARALDAALPPTDGQGQ